MKTESGLRRRFSDNLTRAVRYGLLAFLLTSCASQSNSVEQIAQANDLRLLLQQGAGFDHVVYENKFVNAGTKELHVYISGDGTPWVNNLPAKTPRINNPLTLRLMAKDTAPAIYLGRPCYHITEPTTACTPALWTNARYSNEVITSMTEVIKGYVNASQVSSLVLIGYSGGGTLATLLARHIGETTTVVTIAANLDTRAWTEHHNFDALTHSLNPATQQPLGETIVQLHLIGGLDQVVPAASQAGYFDVNKSARLWTYPAFDHVCCWEKQWPKILKRINGKTDQAHY